MGTRSKLIKFIFVVSMFIYSSLASIAIENALSGIDVKQVGDSDYNVTLRINSTVQVQKIFNGEDNLTLLLKETLPTDSVEIVYDNAADLQNVIVQKKNNGDTAVLLQGKNIQNAKIYTKDLSTGLIVQNSNNKFYITNKKALGCSVLAILLFFMSRLISRPKSERYTSVKTNVKNVKSAKKVTVNTLRKKNNSQSRNIPSINYKLNGSFGNMSIPKDFVINNQYDERIKKVS